MSSFAPLLSLANAVKPGTVQRQCACGNPSKCECDKEKDKKGAIQRRANTSAKTAGAGNLVSAPVASGIQRASQGGGHSLPAGVRRQMESGFGGRDLSGVRVHNDGHAHQLAESLQANAFTTGNHIFFGASQYQPGSKEGQRLLAHELTHVVQQSSAGRGAVQPRLELGAVDTPAEREADRVAEAIVSGFRASPAVSAPRSLLQRQPRHPVLQDVPKGTPVTQPLAGKANNALVLPENVPFLLPADKAESDEDFDWLYKLYLTAARNRRLRTTHAGRLPPKPPDWSGSLWSLWAAGRPHDFDADKIRATELCSPDHIQELQVGGADSPNNLRLLSRDRNKQTGMVQIWREQIEPLTRGIDRGKEWIEFSNVKKSGQVRPAKTTKPYGRISNDPDCMAKDPLPKPQGAITIERFLRTLKFVAGGAETRMGYRHDGVVPTVYQYVVAGAQMNEVVENKKDGTHTIRSEVSPHLHKFPIQGPKTFNFRTKGPQPKEDGDESPELMFVTNPPGTLRLDFPFMSSAFLTPALENRQLRASGDLTPTKPILKSTKVHLEIADSELRGGVRVAADAVRAALPIPGLTIDPVSLEIMIRNGEWDITGGFDFKYANLIKGHLDAGFHNGIQATGWFDLALPGIAQARGEVGIKDGRFVGGLKLTPKDLQIPVKSAGLGFQIADGKLTGSGHLGLAIPPLKDVNLNFMANSQGEVSIVGQTTGSIPGLNDLSVEFGYQTGVGIFAHGSGSLKVAGLSLVRVEVDYRNGKLSGGLEVDYSKGRLKGKVKVWLTPEHKLGGHGEVDYEIVKGVWVVVGVDVLENGTTQISAGVKLPDPLPLFKTPKGINATPFKPQNFTIPLLGFPGFDLEAIIGVGLSADASIGPAYISGAKILSNFNPEAEGQELGFIAQGDLVIPAQAGVAFTVDGALQLSVLFVGKARGGVKFTLAARLCGAVTIKDLQLKYQQGNITASGCACLMASPCLSLNLEAGVRVFLDFWVGTVTIYENSWPLGSFNWGSDFTVGVIFPFHHSFGNDNFELPDDNVKFIYPDIGLGSLLKRLLPV